MRPFSVLAIATSLLLSVAVPAEELSRRAHVGIGIGEPPPGVKGATLTQVVPNGPTAQSGFLTGDVVLQVGDRVVADPSILFDIIKTATEGGAFPTRILRGGEKLTLQWEMKALPKEEHPGLETIYTSVDVAGRRHRAIVTKPSGDGPFPSVLLVTGLFCGTVDMIGPPTSPHPMYRLPDQFSRAGFAVLKVEKSGIGDSIGPSCHAVGVQVDLETWCAAFAMLGTLPYVDPDQRFIFGEGFGGTIAPHAIGDESVRGIITHGAWYGDFFEYSLAGTRRAAMLQGAAPDAMVQDLRAEAEFLSRLLFRREMIGDISRSSPAIAEFTKKYSASEDHFLTRSSVWFHELADLDLTTPWKAVPCDVLVLWGSHDLYTDRAYAESLTTLVNSSQEGRATFQEITGANHQMLETPPGKPAPPGTAAVYHPGPGDAAIAWMKQRM